MKNNVDQLGLEPRIPACKAGVIANLTKSPYSRERENRTLITSSQSQHNSHYIISLLFNISSVSTTFPLCTLKWQLAHLYSNFFSIAESIVLETNALKHEATQQVVPSPRRFTLQSFYIGHKYIHYVTYNLNKGNISLHQCYLNKDIYPHFSQSSLIKH